MKFKLHMIFKTKYLFIDYAKFCNFIRYLLNKSKRGVIIFYQSTMNYYFAGHRFKRIGKRFIDDWI